MKRLAPFLVVVLVPAGACTRFGFGFGPLDAAPATEETGTDAPQTLDSAGDSPRSEKPRPPDLQRPDQRGNKNDSRPTDVRPADVRPPDSRPADVRRPDVRRPDTRQPDTVFPGPSLTSAHDTCATPLAVDLSSLPSGGEVSLLIVPSGSVDDYHLGPCSGRPDMVVKLTGCPGGTFHFWCSGGGPLGMGYSQTAQACGTTSSTTGTTCVGGSNVNTAQIASGTTYLIVCRAASDGAAVLTLKR